jgi:hypothetical protein
MGEDKECCCEEKHESHICTLILKGKTRKVRDISSTPNVACINCGAEANSRDCVCLPITLFI